MAPEGTNPDAPDPSSASELRRALLAWWDAGHRDLPWRRDPRPWPVWVSEVMLQQTRVTSVLAYFARFLARFPTPRALAEASVDEALAAWAGLGYYRRVRMLKAGAEAVVARHGGEIPDDPEAFGAIPGVGPYTCGAVMSIAFGRALPAVDGNVIRVLARLDHHPSPATDRAQRRAIDARAAELARGGRPGDLNLALMELGATVCTPRGPQCLLCPWSASCLALTLGVAERVPSKPPAKARPTSTWAGALVHDEAGRVWLGRRPDEGLLAGMWEPPQAPLDAEAFDLEAEDTDGSDEPSAAAVATALAALGLRPTGRRALCQVEHAFTHRRWVVHLFAAEGRPAAAGYTRVEAFPVEALEALPLSGPALKALRGAGLPVAHRRGAGKR